MPLPNLQARRTTPTRMKEDRQGVMGASQPIPAPMTNDTGTSTTLDESNDSSPELIRKPWLRIVATDANARTHCSLFLGDPCGNACHSSSRGRIYKPWPPTPMRGRIALFKEGSVVAIIYRYKG